MKHELIQREKYLLIVDDSKKTIAHLPLNGATVLEGVDLLPPLEDDVKMLAEQEFDRPYIVDMGTDITPAYQQGFVVGYNKAKEKYKYPEEDLRKAFNAGLMNRYSRTGEAVAEEEFIKSLQQPKMPVGFECEVERIYPNHQTISKEYDFDDILIERKTTTNSQGQTVWVGKYIY